jgi:5-(carboxyamino)imidazole ribonucleotide synthase
VRPGATLGILGGGQLGRFLALAARGLGLRSIVLDPTQDCPASQAADKHVRAAFDDLAAAAALARESDVVTLEWELIPAETLRRIETEGPLHPSSRELSLLQDRLTQKRFLEKEGFPQTPFRAVEDASQLEEAAVALGFPCLLKRRKAGYDGKGQKRLDAPGDFAAAGELLAAPCVLEAWTRFEKEISVILARGRDGAVAFYPVAENIHQDSVLRTTLAPARVPRRTARRAQALAGRLAEALGHVGVMTVEFFLMPEGSLLVNEIAPRVHNSGHYTLGACATSQFEQHVRAVAGLPLGDPAQKTPAVMVNLLGELWAKGEPDWRKLEEPGVTLHLYGKKKAAPGRKMGHFLVLDADQERALARAGALLRRLEN